MAKHAVGAPFFGELNHRARQIAVKLFELRFEAREEREGIGGGSGESSENLVAIKAAQLLSG
jgi:hypothetical protein